MDRVVGGGLTVFDLKVVGVYGLEKVQGIFHAVGRCDKEKEVVG